MTAPAVLRRWAGPATGPALTGAAVREGLGRLRRLAPLGALLGSGLAAHVAVMPHLAVGGAAPDGLLVAVVAVAAACGRRPGAAFGFAAGLGADLFLTTPLGTSALGYTLLGHALGRSARPGPSGAAAALCTPESTCFACRAGGRHPAGQPAAPGAPQVALGPARLRRRSAGRRAVFRRSLLVVLLGVAAGRLGVAAVATALGGVPFPDGPGLLSLVTIAAISAPLGPPVFGAVRRLTAGAGARP